MKTGHQAVSEAKCIFELGYFWVYRVTDENSGFFQNSGRSFAMSLADQVCTFIAGLFMRRRRFGLTLITSSNNTSGVSKKGLGPRMKEVDRTDIKEKL